MYKFNLFYWNFTEERAKMSSAGFSTFNAMPCSLSILKGMWFDIWCKVKVR